MSVDPHEAVASALNAAARGDKLAAAELTPLMYAELRRLAQRLMARTPPGNTLQPTALVHEAYARLVAADPRWENRAHFFGAAAMAMRQILVEQARRKASLKRGGGRKRVGDDAAEPVFEPPSVDILALDEALERLQRHDPTKARIVMLRYFAGLSREETAELLGMSLRTLDREWRYIVARLHHDVADAASGSDGLCTDES